MSIYIKDMKMPKDGVYWCEIGVAGEIATITIHGEDRKSFPLITVQPHGRLIDADRLENIIFESLNNAIADCNSTPFGEALCTSIAKNIVDEIDAAPTIIQADKPKKEVSDDNVILKIEEK